MQQVVMNCRFPSRQRIASKQARLKGVRAKRAKTDAAGTDNRRNRE